MFNVNLLQHIMIPPPKHPNLQLFTHDQLLKHLHPRTCIIQETSNKDITPPKLLFQVNKHKHYFRIKINFVCSETMANSTTYTKL